MRKGEVVIISILYGSIFCIDLEVTDIAKRTASRAKNGILESSALGHYKNFGTWNYEGAMVFRGLWEIQEALSDQRDFDIEPFLNDRLNFFQDDPDQFGYKILHNESLSLNGSTPLWPWLLSIGDTIGLFPIVYGDRLRYGSGSLFNSSRAQKDIYIIEETVKNYILGYPWHLDDFTISRPYSWPSEGLIELTGEAIWVDDIFMGTALQSELAFHTGNQTYALEAASDVLKLQNHLLANPEEFILSHGFNNRTQHFSCCKWARGNGWAIMGAAEALSALQQFPELYSSNIYQQLLQNFQHHAGNLSKLQSQTDGRWHNILDDPDSFLETSSTAMILTAILRGVTNAWLDGDTFLSTIHRSWMGIKTAIDFDGTVLNIIGETGIKDNSEGYAPKSTRYEDSAPGIGAVLRAIAAVAKFQHKTVE